MNGLIDIAALEGYADSAFAPEVQAFGLQVVADPPG